MAQEMGGGAGLGDPYAGGADQQMYYNQLMMNAAHVNTRYKTQICRHF